MNNEETHFHDLLNEPPFDESYRKEHRDQLRQRVLETFDTVHAERSRLPVRYTFRYWKKTLSRAVPRLAAAALFIATLCAVLIVLLQAQPTVAFANLAEPILKAKTAKFNTVVEGKDLPKHTVLTLVLEPNRLRQEMPTGLIYISDFNVGRMLILTPAEKSATLFKLTDLPAQQKPTNFFDQLKTSLRAADGDASVVRESLGRKQLAGREAVGFRLKQANADMAIWGDAKTGLPIVVEMQLALLPDTKITLTDFQFDVKLDEALFKTEGPDGYSIENFNIAPPPEKALTAALKLLCDHNEGWFPDTFDRSAIVACMTKWVQRNPGEPDAAWKRKVMDLSLSLNGGLVFAATLPPESNARYAGKGIKYNDATTSVFWYKVAAASHYRVIYGDLSVREQKVAPESRTGVPVKMGNPVNDWMLELMNKKPATPIPVAPALAPKLEPMLPPKNLTPVAPRTPANQSRLHLHQNQLALARDCSCCRLELMAKRTTNPIVGGEFAYQWGRPSDRAPDRERGGRYRPA